MELNVLVFQIPIFYHLDSTWSINFAKTFLGFQIFLLSAPSWYRDFSFIINTVIEMPLMRKATRIGDLVEAVNVNESETVCLEPSQTACCEANIPRYGVCSVGCSRMSNIASMPSCSLHFSKNEIVLLSHTLPFPMIQGGLGGVWHPFSADVTLSLANYCFF